MIDAIRSIAKICVNELQHHIVDLGVAKWWVHIYILLEKLEVFSTSPIGDEGKIGDLASKVDANVAHDGQDFGCIAHVSGSILNVSCVNEWLGVGPRAPEDRGIIIWRSHYASQRLQSSTMSLSKRQPILYTKKCSLSA